MVAAIYARKSTSQDVADEAKSCTRQVEHAKAFARKKGWSTPPHLIFVDDGISGAEFANRPAFVRMMAMLKPKPVPVRVQGRRPVQGPPFGALIMSEESRLGRESIEVSYALKQLVQANVEVWLYLDNRQRTLDSPTDKILMSLVAYADELEREKARQRVTDTMIRKAKMGHACGAPAFGYRNVRQPAGHVECVIYEPEAAVVRKAIELGALGHGEIATAKALNAMHALAPRAQQGRPSAWSPSSVREVWFRTSYIGRPTYFKTRKRNRWGQLATTDRPQSEWITADVPRMRIVSDVAWNALHARLTQTRESYLRSTGGQLWGRPTDGTARRYLLTGLSRCGRCGGSLEVRSRKGSKGKPRVFFYACSSYYRRGKSVCGNNLELPLVDAETAVLNVLESELLTPAFVDDVCRRVLLRRQTGAAVEEHRALLTKALGEVKAELARLVEGLAIAGSSPATVEAITSREVRVLELQQELVALDHRATLSDAGARRVEALARAKVAEWSRTMRKQMPIARQVLQKLLKGRLVFTPETRGKVKGYRFAGEGSLIPLLVGMVPALSQAVASPPGFEPGFWP
jgi:DNA invertase Pin-like site-specific DNA recombinase